ncbi:MAG: GNAT family N-acetyltransferase [Myxococcales bacterium]|nr:GNAT family N-acetyltransferase [Myxococcales bacterium]
MLVVRRATSDDLPRAAALAAELVRQHHAVDPGRFMLVDGVEAGYERWFHHELGREQARILVAERSGEIVGYAYGTLEARDWNLLLDEHGAIHDVLVAEPARRGGTGRRLVEALIAELEALGAQRIVLSTMVENHAAQRLFAACGFRPTLLEMTRNRATDPR